MSAFFRGQALGENDLFLTFDNASGQPQNAAEISYALYDLTSGAEQLLGAPDRIPVNPTVGHYYASVLLPLDANVGKYHIKWTWREYIGGPIINGLFPFEIIDKAIPVTSQFTDCQQSLIHSLRVMLRDNNPDRNYRFRPPAHEETVGQYNRVFGHIWLDEELAEYLLMSLNRISTAPPMTPFGSVEHLLNYRFDWRGLLINGAMIDALFAVSTNAAAESFNYSIGGVSLDIDQFSRYESLHSAIKDRFNDDLEKAKRTVKIIRGLQQPRYGIGIRSSFGPNVGSGVLSPKKFLGI